MCLFVCFSPHIFYITFKVLDLVDLIQLDLPLILVCIIFLLLLMPCLILSWFSNRERCAYRPLTVSRFIQYFRQSCITFPVKATPKESKPTLIHQQIGVEWKQMTKPGTFGRFYIFLKRHRWVSPCVFGVNAIPVKALCISNVRYADVCPQLLRLQVSHQTVCQTFWWAKLFGILSSV